jgi:OMF family outer membrane factor
MLSHLLLAASMLVPSLPPADVAGASAPNARTLTLEAAWRGASQGNPSLVAARQAMEAAQAGLDGALATRLPFLTAEATALNPNGTPVSNARGSLVLGYDLDTHGARDARIRSGDLGLKLARVALARASQNLRYEVAAAYYDLQGALEQVRIARLNVSNGKTTVSDAVAQREAGDATEFDVQRAKVLLAAAEQGLAEAQAGLTIAQRGLVRLLGADPRNAFLPAAGVEAVKDWSAGLEASIAQALTRRPELVQRDLEQQLARASAQAALSARGLQSNVFVSSDAAVVAPGLGGGAFGGLPASPDYTVGARASWLLVDWGANGWLARQAELGGDVARSLRRDAELQIRLEVEQAYASLTAARANIRTAEMGLGVARLGLASARLRFKGGVGTQTDVLLAQADMIQAEGNRVKALIGFNKAVAQLEQLSAALELPDVAP